MEKELLNKIHNLLESNPDILSQIQNISYGEIKLVVKNNKLTDIRGTVNFKPDIKLDYGISTSATIPLQYGRIEEAR